MSRSIVVASLCLAVLAGCSRTVIREQVVEKPVVQRETVVERPTLMREAIVAAPAACSVGTAVYSSGTLSCQAGFEYRCRNGVWERIPGSAC